MCFLCLIVLDLQSSPDVVHLCLLGSAPFLLYFSCVERWARAFAWVGSCKLRLKKNTGLSFRLNLKIPFQSV